jgi:hypothetical protein
MTKSLIVFLLPSGFTWTQPQTQLILKISFSFNQFRLSLDEIALVSYNLWINESVALK